MSGIFNIVSPPPAEQVGCRPLNFLNLINLKFLVIGTPNGYCIL